MFERSVEGTANDFKKLSNYIKENFFKTKIALALWTTPNFNTKYEEWFST